MIAGATMPRRKIPASIRLAAQACDEHRALRDRAHHTFDRIWTNLNGAVTEGDEPNRRRAKAKRRVWRRQREAAYAWLADQLGRSPGTCHFGQFDAATLRHVIELVEAADHDAVRHYRRSDA